MERGVSESFSKMETPEVWIDALSDLKTNHDKENVQRTLQNAIYFLKNSSKSDKKKVVKSLFGQKEDESTGIMFNENFIKYGSKEVHEVFQILSYDTYLLFTKKKILEEDISVFVDHLQILLKLMSYLPNASSLYHLRIILDLSIIFIKRCPELESKLQSSAVKVFKQSFIQVNKLDKNIQIQYFSSMFYQGILLSISNDLFLSAGLEDLQNLSVSLKSYENYLFMWHSLFKWDSYSAELHNQIFSVFTRTLILFFKDLIPCLKRENVFQFRKSPLSKLVITTNLKFNNLVGLCTKIFDEIEIFTLQNQLEELLKFLIKSSYRYLHLAGLYKLISVLLKKTNQYSCFTVEICQKYLSDIITIVPTLPENLKIVCIKLILNAPLILISNITIDKLIPVFNIAFIIGIDDPRIAFLALKNLKKQRDDLCNQSVKDIIKSIFFNLIPYLTKHIDSNISSEYHTNFQIIQKEILSLNNFYDSNLLISNLKEKTLEESVLVFERNSLKFEFSYSDSNVEIFLDKFIEKLSNIYSLENRREKLSTGELLHVNISLILGNQLSKIYLNEKLFFAIIKLSCDSDDAIKTLYRPLVTQLMNYLSLKPVNISKDSQEFVRALIKGLTDFNLLIRDYCRQCLKEFIGLMKLNEGTSSRSVSVDYFVNIIISFEASKTSSAAMILFYLHSFFGSNIVFSHWLNFFKKFVKDLEVCHSDENYAIDYLLNMIKDDNDNDKGFTKNVNKKKNFLEVSKSAVDWLLIQCHSLNKDYRDSCMKVFPKLFEIVFKTNKEFFKFYNHKNHNMMVLEGFENNFEEITCINRELFLKSLDIYTWLFNQNFLQPESLLLLEIFPEVQVFYEYFKKFVLFVNNEYENEDAKKIVLKILEFTTAVLSSTKEEKTLMNILNNFWDDNFSRLLYHFAINPQKLNIIELIQLEKSLRTIIEKTPNEYLIKVRENLLTEYRDYFKKFMDFQGVTLMDDIIPLKNFIRGITILIKCKLFDFQTKQNELHIDFKEKILNVFDTLNFNQKHYHESENSTQIQIKDDLVDYLEFCLLNYQPDLIRTVLDSILQDSSNVLTISNQEFIFQIFRPTIYQCMLKNPVDTYNTVNDFLDKHPDKILLLIEDFLTFSYQNQYRRSLKDESDDFLHPIVANLEIFCNKILSNFNLYEKLVVDNNQRYNRFFNILKLSITFIENPESLKCAANKKSDVGCLSKWLLQKLNNAQNLEEKSIIFESFFEILDLESSLHDLRDSDSASWLQKLTDDKFEKLQSIFCLRTLFKVLFTSRSWPILNGIIKFCAGACKIFSSENIDRSVKNYFYEMSDNDAYGQIEEIFSLFQSLNLQPEERLDILEYFLLPALQVYCEKFFLQNYENLSKCIAEKINDAYNDMDNIVNRKQNLISKIGCFKILELAYSKIPSDKLSSCSLDKNETLTSFLIKKALETCNLNFKFSEEKEFMRLLHCAFLNCLLSVACSENQEHLYDLIFREIDWEKIVDVERAYDFSPIPTTYKSKPINLKYAKDEFYRLFDGKDQGKAIKLEDDDLNDHECMAMLTGAILYFFNSDATRRETYNKENMPKWLSFFHLAFLTEKANVNIFFMRIISNVKVVFLFYITHFFNPIVTTMCSYLKSNPINYIVRDVLVILIEAEFVPKHDESNLAQSTIEILIDRAEDPCHEIFTYNLELIEKLVSIWAGKLKIPIKIPSKYPQNIPDPTDKFQTSPDFCVRILLILFKYEIECDKLIVSPSVHSLVRKKMFRWIEPITPHTYELLGHIMKHITEEQRDTLMKEDLFEKGRDKQSLFFDVQKYNIDLCIHLLYRLTLGCPSIALYPNVRQFANPKDTQNPDRKAESYSILLYAVPQLLPSDILLAINKKDLLRTLRDENFASCRRVVLEIIRKLVEKFEAKELTKYIKTVGDIAISSSFPPEEKKLAYEIIIDVFEKFSKESSDSVTDKNKTLTTYCKRRLIAAVTDPDVRDLVMSFWTQQPESSISLEDRFVRLMQMYETEIHQNFAQFACSMLLDLAIKATDDEKFLFEPLVKNCHFESYKITIPKVWDRKKRLIPLGTPLVMNLEDHCELFENLDRLNASNKILDPSENKLSKRKFLPYPKNPEIYLPSNDNKSECQTVPKFIRQYWTGKYPDVRITQRDVVASIENHARYDRDFASTTLLDLIGSMKINSEIENVISETCSKALKQPNDFAPVAIEMLYRTGCKKYNADDIVKICKSMSCEALGILLLERDSCNFWNCDDSLYLGPNQKKLIGTVKGLHYWVQLASLYHSVGEHDMVVGIFKNWNLLQSDSLRQGCLAESEQNWLEAKKNYERAYEIEFGFSKDYCLEGAFRCMSELSSWIDINNKINTILNSDNLESIWKSSKKNELLPWIVTGQLHRTLETISFEHVPNNDDELSSLLTHCSQDPELLQLYGNELSIIHLYKDLTNVSEAKLCLESFLTGAYQHWLKSSLITDERRRRVLENFQAVNEVNEVLKALEMKDSYQAMKKLTNYWDEVDIQDDDELLKWNKIVGYRLVFGLWMIDKMKDDIMTSTESLMDLSSEILDQRLKISALALKCNNSKVSQKHLTKAKGSLEQLSIYLIDDFCRLNKLSLDHTLLSSQYKFMEGSSQTSPQLSFDYFCQSWKLVTRLTIDVNVDHSTRLKANQLVYKITKKLQDLLNQNHECIKLAFDDKFMMQTLNIEYPENIEDALFSYNYDILKSICQQGNNEERAENYLRLIEYYQELISETYDKSFILQRELTTAVLTAMSLGSYKAAKYFPSLLNDSIFKSDEKTADIFTQLCPNVPSWMFLFWQEQIMLHLTTPLKPYVIPIIHKLAVEYPSAIMFSFKNFYEIHLQLQEDEFINSLYKLIFTHPKIENLLNALNNLCHPEEFIKYQLLDFIQALSEGEMVSTAINSLINKVFSNAKNKKTCAKSPAYKKILEKYRNDLKKLHSEKNFFKFLDAKRSAMKIMTELDKGIRLRLDKDKSFKFLNDFSTDLENFLYEDFEIEMPGQYYKFGKPLERFHPKVFKFVPCVDTVITKKQVHLKISIFGTNGKIYPFLVKCGADLRRDQRMQQLFEVANEIFKWNVKCQKRNLFINTYSVVPLNKYLGLIGWVENTKSLSELIESSNSDKSVLEAVTQKYQDWIEESHEDASQKNKDYYYKQALKKYDAREVISKMKEFAGCFDRDLLRKTFIKLCSSVDEFLQLRRNFTISYATTCLVNWLAGVGNRCLDNTLIKLNTGDCVSINFGIVFGSGLEQPIPELVPFRLTVQILNFLKPYTQKDLLGIIMIHALTAMKSEKKLFLSCMKVFINEPLNWNQKLNEQLQKINIEHKDVIWSSEKKFASACKKLSNKKSTSILIEELSHLAENEDNEYFKLYELIINGRNHSFVTARSCIKNDDLTPEDQVNCLLDHATDANVLGRMCVSWSPFI